MSAADFQAEVNRLTPLLRKADELHHKLQELWKEGQASVGATAYKESETYARSLSEYHAAQQQLEAATDPILDLLRRGRREAIAPALAYLSIRHRPFRSGYFSQMLARALKKIALNSEEANTLRSVILDRLTWPWTQSRDLWRLIPKFRTPDFDEALSLLAKHKDDYVQRRARRIMSEHLRSGRRFL